MAKHTTKQRPIRRKKRHSSSFDARASNAGDRYHLAYAARRALEMLHPSSHLKSIAIEGVAPADQSLQRDERTFLAADLTEYYGGTDAHSAEAIVLVQVKYSPLRPSTPWTLSRLVSEDHAGGRAKARSSVFRKLADMFDAMAPGGAAGTPGVTLRLLTNQPLSSGLRAELQAIRLAFSQSPRAAGRRASQLPAKPRSTAVRLQKASGLSWPRFRQLMACWDLHSFDQAMLAAEESQIFSGIAGAFPDASIRVEALLSHLQTASTPGRRVDISRSDVLAFLRLREDELFPAPPVLPDDGNLFSTVASRELRRTLEGVDGIVVVHGRAGVGKTSALQVALREHGAAVVFDCYAGGAGLRPGHERFGYTVCLVQLINELERRFRTSILATTQLSYRPLLRRFEEAVRAAASVASSEGKRLVVAIDAVDNAIEQRRRSISNDDPFLPLLWEVVWPKNCAIALSFRTENEGDVVPPGVSPAKRVEVLGFSEPELSKLATTRSAVIPSGDIAFLHQRTRGNPRVAAKVLDELAEAPNVSARQLIESTARATAFDYYEQELGRRLAAADLRAALAVLYELRQPPALDTLAAALGRAEADLRRGLGALSFGVHVTDVDTVRWNDQDFLDWVGERLKGERTTAQQRIADYCIGRFAVDAYARWNLSYHFLAAGRHDELLQWWSTPGRIEAQKLAAQPHEERVLEDIRAVITAAVRLGRDEDAILWLFRAAALAGGRDAFSDALSSNVEVAVDADLVGLLDDEVTAGATRPAAGRGGSPHRRRTGRRANADEDFRLASALARRPERREDAARLFHRAAAVKQEEYAAHPQSGGRLYMDVWAAVARYHVRVNGLERALRWATRSSSRPWSWQMAAVAAADWRAGQVSDPFGIINVARINGPAKCGALLGVLSARPADSPAGSGLSDLKSAWVRRSVRTIKRQLGRSPALRTEFSGGHTLPHSNVLASAFLDAVEQLTAANLMVDARSLLQVWAPPKPLDWLPSIVEPYLRWHALSEALGVTKFDPDANEHPPRGAVASEKKPDDSEHQRLRREMKALYPALRARALAWAGARDATAAIRAALSQEHHVDQAYVISQSTTAARLLEGVIALQKRDDKLVQEILDALERGRRGRRDDLDVLMPEVLSQDSRYLGVADRLVREELARCRPPSVPGPEAVGRLLALYKPARRIDQELARQVIEQARDVAGEVDSLAPDRAAALERITAAACSLSDSGPDATLLDRICALTGYWLGISQEGVSVHWAIERLAGRDPVAAVERASILDRDGLYPISRASMAIVSGALSTGVGSRGELWPLLEIGAETREFPKVAKNVIEGLFGERNGVAGVALRSVSRLIRIRAAEGRSDGLRELIECASWVEALGETGEANGLRAIADAIGADIDTTQSRQDGPSWPGENENAEPEIVSRVLSLNRHSARRALEVLEAATSEELASIATAQFGRLVATLARDLPIGDRRRVAQVIERWAGTGAYRIDEAVVLLNALVEQASDSVVPEDVRLDVANALAHLLNPDVIERASFDWEPRLSAAIFSGSWASQEERRRTLMEKVAVSLTDLPAGSLFRVFARVASLLDPSAAVRTVESVVQETMNSAPYQYRAVPVGVAPQRTTAVLLARCLSHPSLSARWAALYGVVSGLCDSQGVLGSSESAEGQRAGGVTLLEGLMREFDDESQPMWAAAREWLAFALLHVAGRSPKMLKPFADSLLRHALSADFPHVKIRAHLSGAIRAANAAAALELSPDTLRALEAINRPQGEVHKDAAFVAAPLLARGLLESDGIEIDDWDTKRYWYQPMMESFPVEPRELAESVQLAAKKWSARVGVTKLGADTQRANMRDRYEWSDIDNRQGQEPRVELLEMHGARQALFLLAGDLIDQIPVRSGDWFDRWPSFMRYRARGADPELTGRWVDAPPAVPDNYGIVREPIVEWCKNRKEEAYLRELTAGVPKGWFVLSGSRQASEWNWSYSYTVDAALVDARTACSLVRLLEDPDQDAHGYLPFWEPHYDCTVLEAYEACCTGSDLAHVKGEHAGRNGRFRLFTTDIGFSQELPLHSSDSSWPGTSRRYILPSPRIADTLGWRRAFGQPSWRDSSGAEVAKYETWHVERRGRSASGQRLIIRADQVGETLLAGGSDGPLDLIVQVRLRREERRGSDRVGQLDMGSGRVFLWSQISNGIV